MSEDAGKNIFIYSFLQVDDLLESSGLKRTDPEIATPVLRQKPSKPATEQEGKYCDPCFTHREQKQRNPQ